MAIHVSSLPSDSKLQSLADAAGWIPEKGELPHYFQYRNMEWEHYSEEREKLMSWFTYVSLCEISVSYAKKDRLLSRSI